MSRDLCSELLVQDTRSDNALLRSPRESPLYQVLTKSLESINPRQPPQDTLIHPAAQWIPSIERLVIGSLWRFLNFLTRDRECNERTLYRPEMRRLNQTVQRFGSWHDLLLFT
jgi:hypothetical protein